MCMMYRLYLIQDVDNKYIAQRIDAVSYVVREGNLCRISGAWGNSTSIEKVDKFWLMKVPFEKNGIERHLADRRSRSTSSAACPTVSSGGTRRSSSRSPMVHGCASRA